MLRHSYKQLVPGAVMSPCQIGSDAGRFLRSMPEQDNSCGTVSQAQAVSFFLSWTVCCWPGKRPIASPRGIGAPSLDLMRKPARWHSRILSRMPYGEHCCMVHCICWNQLICPLRKKFFAQSEILL